MRLVSGSSGLLDDVGELLELSLGSEEGTELEGEREGVGGWCARKEGICEWA